MAASLYCLLPNGGVANQQRLKITNQISEPQRFTIELVSPAGASLVLSDSPVTVELQQLAQVNAVVTAPPSVFDDGMAKGRYLVTSDRGFRQEVEFVLLGPYDDDQDHKHDRDDHRGEGLSFRRLLSDYRWPIYLGGLLTMSIVACGILVYVATRPDAPLSGYYEAAGNADEAVEAASWQLGWTVRYELPAGVPHVPGMPRPVDVQVSDRDGRPVGDLAGSPSPCGRRRRDSIRSPTSSPCRSSPAATAPSCGSTGPASGKPARRETGVPAVRPRGALRGSGRRSGGGRSRALTVVRERPASAAPALVPTAGSRCRRASSATARPSSSAARAVARCTRWSVSGASTSTTGWSSARARESSRRR